MIGLDTSAIIDLFKGESKAQAFFEKNKELYVTTIISYLELFFGIDPENKKHSIEAEYYRNFFEDNQIIGLSEDSCEEASKILWRLKKEGNSIEDFDCVIAGILIANGINKIVTKNKKHFDRIKELKVISY